MPTLTPGISESPRINPVSLKQSTPEHQRSATFRAVCNILGTGKQEVYPTQVMMIEENKYGNINLGELLNSLLEKKQNDENNKPEGQRKDVSLDDIYSQVIGNMKELGLSNLIKTPTIRQASDDARLLSELIINEELLLSLYKIAYEKQLEEIRSRLEGHYSGKDTSSTEKSLEKINQKLHTLKKENLAA